MPCPAFLLRRTCTGLQVWHHDAHRAQVIATARLMELCDSMLSVCPQGEVTLWYPPTHTHWAGTLPVHGNRIHLFHLAFAQGCFL